MSCNFLVRWFTEPEYKVSCSCFNDLITVISRHDARQPIGELPNKFVFRDHNSADKPPLARSQHHLQAAACEQWLWLKLLELWLVNSLDRPPSVISHVASRWGLTVITPSPHCHTDHSTNSLIISSYISNRLTDSSGS